MIFQHLSLPNKPLNVWMPFLSWRLKLLWTADKEFSSLRHTLHGDIASSGLSAASSMVAMTRYCIARIRSDVSKPLLKKALVALLRDSLNLSFERERALLADSSQAACVVAPCSLVDLAICPLSNRSYSNSIPWSKKMVLASKFFFDNNPWT